MNAPVPPSPKTGPARGVLEDPPEFEGRRRLTLAVLFVLLSLAALVLVPLGILWHVTSLRSRLQVVREARHIVDELQLSFARSAADVRAFIIVRDPALTALFEQIVRGENQQFDSLAVLGASLGIEADVATLRARARDWHEEHNQLLSGAMTTEEYARRYPPGRFMTEALLEPASVIAHNVSARAARYQADVVRTERGGAAVMVLLALLAAGSAAIVARAARDYRETAMRERLLREAAIVLTEARRLGDVLERIALTAARVDPVQNAYVERVVNDGREVEVVAAVGVAAPSLGLRFPYPHSFTEAAAASGGTTIIADVGQSSSPIAAQLCAAGACPTALVNLLRADDIVHGSLVLMRYDAKPYRPADVEQVRVFAVLASLALHSAVMLDDAERRHSELRQLTESRDRLIRGFTHDVKNPLNAADGYAQLLESGVISEPKERDESIHRIRATIKTALGLIDDIVEMARAESAALSVQREEVSIVDLAERVLTEFRAAAEASGHALLDELPLQLPVVMTDAARVRQILSNLVTNALKHTPRGGTVRLAAAAGKGGRDDDPTDWVRISVADDGPGIPEADQRLLFQEFVRLAPTESRGAGLGLAISQRIAKLLGGRITLESRPGVGSMFTLWLPLAGKATSYADDRTGARHARAG